MAVQVAAVVWIPVVDMSIMHPPLLLDIMHPSLIGRAVLTFSGLPDALQASEGTCDG